MAIVGTIHHQHSLPVDSPPQTWSGDRVERVGIDIDPAAVVAGDFSKVT